MTPVEARRFCRIDEGAQGLLQMAMRQLQLSARAFHRILKVSHTIAGLAGADGIGAAHMAEALQSRARGLGWGHETYRAGQARQTQDAPS